MRRYIRHPSDMPIEFSTEAGAAKAARPLKNIGVGGLCFVSEKPLDEGAKIHIHIPLEFRPKDDRRGFSADGFVAWCMPENNHFTIGVAFDDQSAQFGMRMVEQVCHIEHYRHDVREKEGRDISSEEAAREWVERYAETFGQ